MRSSWNEPGCTCERTAAIARCDRLVTRSPRSYSLGIALRFYSLVDLEHAIVHSELLFHLALYLLQRLARHRLDEPLAQLLAQRLELLLLHRIDQRLQLLVEGRADRPHPLDLLHRAEGSVLLHRLELLQLLLQDRHDL